ncbi:hypothetical protein F511_06041 [Dorcoceras hygrometricum]|uniref:Uncharacterized protein n=1 Tax=Dorcoceras hygrometricum TaxID=472368 RepID=A0A2Z7AW96_9LAMI|nr:hypothetical protein F511_06041 [Dorcoceras hygrometricum]
MIISRSSLIKATKRCLNVIKKGVEKARWDDHARRRNKSWSWASLFHDCGHFRENRDGIEKLD